MFIFMFFQIARRASLAAKKAKDSKDPSKGPGQLWDGLVSIILVEGKKLIPMDDSGTKANKKALYFVFSVKSLYTVFY